MTKHYFNKPITSLLSAFIFLTFCNAQTNTPSPTYKLSELKASVTGQSNLIKTQGTNEYQNIDCGIKDKKGNNIGDTLGGL